MKKICFSVAITLFMPVETSAQIRRSCEPRVAIGAALGLLTHDIEVDPALAGVGRFGLATTRGTGLEASVNSTVPISAEWSLTAEFGTGAMAAVQERDASGTYVWKKTGDDVTVRRLQVGLQRHRPSRFLCGYASLAVGLYRYSYRGVALNVPAGAAMMGFEAPQTGSGALFFEIGLSVALTKLEAPTAAEIVTNIRPAVGWRYRF